MRGLVGEPIDADSAAALTASVATRPASRRGGWTPSSCRAPISSSPRTASTARTWCGWTRAPPGGPSPCASWPGWPASSTSTPCPPSDPRARLEAAVREVAAARGSVRPDDRHDLDVEDPYGSPPAVHRQTTDVIAETSGATAGLLAAAADPGLAASVAAERAARNGRPEVRQAPAGNPCPRRPQPRLADRVARGRGPVASAARRRGLARLDRAAGQAGAGRRAAAGRSGADSRPAGGHRAHQVAGGRAAAAHRGCPVPDGRAGVVAGGTSPGVRR